MKKKWYTVSFQAKMSEEDIRAMNKYFYETMADSMQITECCPLDIDDDCEQDDDDYTPSTENGDYSPSNPWDAPGMKISDFI
jgi:hypothetical protein